MAREDERRRRNAASRVRTPSVFSDTGVAGGAFLARHPEDNPAYQAAIAKGRPSRSGYTTITTPSGGRMSVPVGQERKYTDLLSKGSATGAPTGFERPNPQSAYVLGNTGAVPTGNTPYERSFRLGAQGEGPVQQPQPSFGFQVGNTLRNTAPGIIPFAQNAASRIASSVSNFFGGGMPNLIPSAAAAQPSPTPMQTPVPSPTATPTAAPVTGQRLADGRSDLLRDTENTFYGGGNAPVPTPTPTASPAARVASNQPSALSVVQAMQGGLSAGQALAQNQPRRYSDYY